MFLTVVAIITILINISAIIFIIFFERRDSNSTLAWILVLSFLPVLGFIIYLVLGQTLSKRKLFRRKQEYEKKSRETAQKQEIDISNMKDEVKEFSELIKLNYNSEGSIFSGGNSVELIFDGKEKYEKLFKDISEAKEYIHMEYYAIGLDSIGEKLFNALIEKAKEGIEVKLLMDTLGSIGIIKGGCLQELEDSGGDLATFFPKKFPYRSKRVNFVNHRKIVIIDKKVGYLGGFNIGDEYASLNEKIGYWRDTHMRIKGPFLNDLQKRFLFDWCYSKEQNIEEFEEYLSRETEKTDDDVVMQFVSSGADLKEPYIRNGILKIINEAKESIFIQTPYFVPDEPIIEALKIAALSGVDVRIMVPKYSDHSFMRWATSAVMSGLLDCGVNFYLYQKDGKGFIHSKTIVADKKVCSIGTANMDQRSFKLNFESNAFIFDRGISEIQHNKFIEDMKISECVDLVEFGDRSRRTRILESVVRLFSPLL